MAHHRKKETAKEKVISLEKEVCFSIAELDLLCELAKNIAHQHVVVEIADNVRESTKALARGAQQAGARVFNLALYGKGNSAKKTDDVRLNDGTSKAENVNGATILNGSAYNSTRRWKETVGLLVVTGYLQYEDVREAIVCWEGYLPPEAVTVVHNCYEPGPAKAIKEFITDGGNFVLRQTIDNMTALAMDKCQHYWVINSNEIGICRNCGRERNFRRLNREVANLGIRKRTMHRMK